MERAVVRVSAHHDEGPEMIPVRIGPGMVTIRPPYQLEFLAGLEQAQQWITRRAAPFSMARPGAWRTQRTREFLTIYGPFVGLRISVYAEDTHRLVLVFRIEFSQLKHMIEAIREGLAIPVALSPKPQPAVSRRPEPVPLARVLSRGNYRVEMRRASFFVTATHYGGHDAIPWHIDRQLVEYPTADTPAVHYLLDRCREWMQKRTSPPHLRAPAGAWTVTRGPERTTFTGPLIGLQTSKIVDDDGVRFVLTFEVEYAQLMNLLDTIDADFQLPTRGL
ncbi:hypothetical protein [Nocardia terpenica]|nr:hypothetical protein [Nocardia terpenica]NQE88109.1 hypothetical protein [Nocardia terpenica]